MRALGDERSTGGGVAGDEPDEPGEPAAPDRSWHGPASVAGAVVGSFVILLWVAFPNPTAALPDAVHFVLPWVLGLPMLLAHGRVRRFGVGLLASGLLLPALPGTFAVVAVAFHGVG